MVVAHAATIPLIPVDVGKYETRQGGKFPRQEYILDRIYLRVLVMLNCWMWIRVPHLIAQFYCWFRSHEMFRITWGVLDLLYLR